MAAVVIQGDKFSGSPRDWKDVKTEIVTVIANAGCTYVSVHHQIPNHQDHPRRAQTPALASVTSLRCCVQLRPFLSTLVARPGENGVKWEKERVGDARMKWHREEEGGGAGKNRIQMDLSYGSCTLPI